MTREEFLQGEIETYRKKIALYQQMIAEWSRELGHVPPSSQEIPNSHQAGSENKKPAGGDPLALINGLMFFGKSQPEAAKAFLEMVHYPLTTEQILEGITKGGVNVGGKNPKQNLYTILDRSPEFVRVRRGGIWALATWPGVPKKSVEEPGGEEKKQETAES